MPSLPTPSSLSIQCLIPLSSHSGPLDPPPFWKVQGQFLKCSGWFDDTEVIGLSGKTKKTIATRSSCLRCILCSVTAGIWRGRVRFSSLSLLSEEDAEMQGPQANVARTQDRLLPTRTWAPWQESPGFQPLCCTSQRSLRIHLDSYAQGRVGRMCVGRTLGWGL